MQLDESKFLSFENIYPCAPRTKRGDFSSLDIQNGHFLYFNGPTVILRPLNNQKSIKYFVHKSDVLAAKFSYDGKLIASIDEKGTLMIHELGQKQLFEVKKYQNFYPNAKAIDWSADRKRLCVVGSGKQSFGRVVLIQAGTNAGQITGVSANLTCCAFRPQRPYHLVLGGDQFVLKFYQGPPYKFIKSSQKNHTNFINAIKYSPSGKYFISISTDKKIVLYNGQNFEIIGQKINCHQRGILGADWIDDKTFVTVSADKTIKIWNTQLQEINQIKCCEDKYFHDGKSFDHFQVAVKFYEGFIYSLSLNGQILRLPLPSQQEKVVEFNSQKMQKYGGWLSKPLTVQGYRNQSLNKIIAIDSSGKILQIQESLKNNQSNKANLLSFKDQYNSTILQAVSCPQTGSINILWGDGSVSQFIINDSQIIQRMKIDNTKFKLICRPSIPDYNVLAVSYKINAFSNKKVMGSPQIEEDSTFIQAYEKYIFVGTLKGNLYIFNGQTLEFITKTTLTATKLSYIYVERSAKPGSFIIICGDALGKLMILRYDQQTKTFQDLPSTLGNHESLITGILPFKNCEFLFTCGMENKVNLWQKVQQGKYSRQQDWRNIHQFGITSAEIIGDRLFTVGGDYLIKEWKINI